jgi:hypothetical protein
MLQVLGKVDDKRSCFAAAICAGRRRLLSAKRPANSVLRRQARSHVRRPPHEYDVARAASAPPTAEGGLKSRLPDCGKLVNRT